MPEPFIGAKCGGTKAWQRLGDSCKSHQDREDCRIRASGCSVEVETRPWGVEAGGSPVEVLTARGRGAGRRAGGEGEGKGEGSGGGGRCPVSSSYSSNLFLLLHSSPRSSLPPPPPPSLPPPSTKAVPTSTLNPFRPHPPPPLRSTSSYHQSIRVLSLPFYSPPRPSPSSAVIRFTLINNNPLLLRRRRGRTQKNPSTINSRSCNANEHVCRALM